MFEHTHLFGYSKALKQKNLNGFRKFCVTFPQNKKVDFGSE